MGVAGAAVSLTNGPHLVCPGMIDYRTLLLAAISTLCVNCEREREKKRAAYDDVTMRGKKLHRSTETLQENREPLQLSPKG